MFCQRTKEHERFLSWLHKTIEQESIDLLIVAGDIFDTASPPSYSLKMYYQFLASLAGTSCSNVVIISGNHDSAAVLNAPRHILKVLNVHVVASVSSSPEDEIILIRDKAGDMQAVVCAVPFLREADLRKSVPGESWEDKSKALSSGLQLHYRDTAEQAARIMTEQGFEHLPLIGTGHLFASGGTIGLDEHIREIHVGNMEKFNITKMPDNFDYIALGHLHKAQKAGKQNHIRYSGSPIPLSFGEAEYDKYVLKITFQNKKPEIQPIKTPVFQKLIKIKGSVEEIIDQINDLSYTENQNKSEIWAQVLVTQGWEPMAEDHIRKAAESTNLKLFAIKKEISEKKEQTALAPHEDLSHYSCMDIFKKRMDMEHGLDDDLKKELMLAFSEIEILVRQDEKDMNHP